MKTPRLFSLTLAALVALTFTGCKTGKKNGGSGGGADGDYVNGTPLPERQEGVSFLGSNVDRSKFRQQVLQGLHLVSEALNVLGVAMDFLQVALKGIDQHGDLVQIELAGGVAA